ENIGLIEVMGLAVLPARLLKEMDLLADTVLAGKNPEDVPEIASHAAWMKEILKKHPAYAPENVKNQPASKEALLAILQEEIGLVFAGVLEDAGVFKDTKEGREAFRRFAASVH
ncbi:MAG: galactose-1-phosphate uridylyltransferase, partial [Lachnospiraceae bacterium]